MTIFKRKNYYIFHKFGEKSGAVLHFCNTFISDLIEDTGILLFASVVNWEIKQCEASENSNLWENWEWKKANNVLVYHYESSSDLGPCNGLGNHTLRTAALY